MSYKSSDPKSPMQAYFEAMLSMGMHALTEYYTWLLANGAHFDPSEQLPLSAKHQQLVETNTWPKGCFRNAKVAAKKFGMEYVEGFYVVGEIGMPFEHAWCMKDSKIFDPTSQYMNFDVKEYFGLALPKEFYAGKQKGYMTPLQTYYRSVCNSPHVASPELVRL